MTSPRWIFTEHRDGKTSWTWTRYLLTGKVAVTSGSFDSYGEAVSDALKSDFQPAKETWAVTTSNGTRILNKDTPAHRDTVPALDSQDAKDLPATEQPPPAE